MKNYLKCLFILLLVTSNQQIHAANSNQKSTIDKSDKTIPVHSSSQLIWRKSLPDRQRHTLVFDSVLYTIEATHIVARQSKDGQVLWDAKITDDEPGDIRKSPRGRPHYQINDLIVVHDLVIAGISKNGIGSLIAVDRHTGNKIWTYESSQHDTMRHDDNRGIILSQPVSWKSAIIFRTGKGLTSIRRDDGKELWCVPFDPYGDVPLVPSAQPTVGGSAIYFNSDFGIAYAFDPVDGRLIWSRPTEGIAIKKVANVMKINFKLTICHPLLLKDKIIVTDGAGNIYAMRATDGETIWRIHPGYVYQLGSDGRDLYAGTQNGFSRIDMTTGKTLRQYAVPNGILRFSITNDTAVMSGYPTGWQAFSLPEWKTISKSSNLCVNDVLADHNKVYLSGCTTTTQSEGELQAYRISAK